MLWPEIRKAHPDHWLVIEAIAAHRYQQQRLGSRTSQLCEGTGSVIQGFSPLSGEPTKLSATSGIVISMAKEGHLIPKIDRIVRNLVHKQVNNRRGKIKLDQITLLDIDGDGRPESFINAQFQKNSGDGSENFLFMINSRAGSNAQIIWKEGSDIARPIAVTKIAGKNYLILDVAYYERAGIVVGTVDSGGFQEQASAGCGA